MERTITHVKRSSIARQVVLIDSETGEEKGRRPIEYRYFIYYSTPSKPNNSRSFSACSEEQALEMAKQDFARTDAHYAKRNRGANQ